MVERTLMPKPLTRAEFERLQDERARVREQLRQLDITAVMAKARGVERVTVENLTNELAMAFGRRLGREDHATRAALEAWLGSGDTAARDVVIQAMNDEASR